MRLIILGRTQISLQLVKSSLVVQMMIEKCKCSIVRDSVCLSGWLAACLSRMLNGVGRVLNAGVCYYRLWSDLPTSSG